MIAVYVTVLAAGVPALAYEVCITAEPNDARHAIMASARALRRPGARAADA